MRRNNMATSGGHWPGGEPEEEQYKITETLEKIRINTDQLICNISIFGSLYVILSSIPIYFLLSRIVPMWAAIPLSSAFLAFGYSFYQNIREHRRKRKLLRDQGLQVCNVCKGEKFFYVYKTYRDPRTDKVKKKERSITDCSKCNGRGVIDWVQRITA
jgi:hypothetical protein